MTLGAARKTQSSPAHKDNAAKPSRGATQGRGGVPLFVTASARPEQHEESAELGAEQAPATEAAEAGPDDTTAAAPGAAKPGEDGTPDPALGTQDPGPPAQAKPAVAKPDRKDVTARAAATHGAKPVAAPEPTKVAAPERPATHREQVPELEEQPATAEPEEDAGPDEASAPLEGESAVAPDISEADSAADETRDPQIAGARLDTIVGEMQGRGMRSRDAVALARDDATGVLERRAADAQARVRSDARRTTKTVSQLFEAERKHWTKAFEGGDKGIRFLSLLHQAMSWVHGIAAIVGVSDLVTKARDTVEKTVTSSIERVDTIKTTYQNKVHDRTTKLAKDARTLGETKAASYHDKNEGLRNTKQNAVIKLGNKFAAGVEENEPEAKKSIADGVKDVPTNLRKEGDKLAEQLVDPTPKLTPAVIGGATATAKAVDDQSTVARDALRDAGKEAVAALKTGETEALKGVKQIRTVAERQIRKTLRRSRKALRRNADRLLDELEGVLLDATGKLREPALPNIARSRRFAAWVTAQIEHNALRFVDLLPVAVDRLAQPMFDIATEASRQFRLARERTTTTLAEQRSLMDSRLTSTLGEVDKMFAVIVKVFADVLDDTKKDVKTKLDSATDDLARRCKDALDKLDTQIDTKVKEAYDAADAKLPDLGKKMDKAVDKIDWDHRHPILAKVRDIGGFLLGLVVTVLKWALKLVVMLIVAIVLIVLLVVLLPIELATAILIVTVLAVVALVGAIGYATYKRHEEAKKKGIDRGFFANLGLGFCDTVGFTKMYIAITADDLTPYERGKMFGEGVTDLVDVALVFVGVRGAIKNFKIAKPIPFEEPKLGEFRGFPKVQRALNIEPGKMPRIERARAIFEGTKEGFGDLWAKLRGRGKPKVDEPVRDPLTEQTKDERTQNEQQQNEQQTRQEESQSRDQEQRQREDDPQQREQEQQRRHEDEPQQREQEQRQREEEKPQREEEPQRREEQPRQDEAQRERQRQERERAEQEQRERQAREEEQQQREREQRRREDEREQREREEQRQREAEQRRRERQEEDQRRTDEQRERDQREQQERRDQREQQEREAKEDQPDAPAKAARDEAEHIWNRVFEGKQHGRDMFRAARDELANAKHLSPKEKADLFEAIAKEINRRDPSWQANRSEAVDANGKPLAGFFTGEARPFGFAIDGEGRVFQTMNIMESFVGVDPQGRMMFDIGKWTPITPTAPSGGGGGPRGGGGAPGAEPIKVEGHGQRPTVEWKPNADGRRLTLDEAVELARKWGVEIPEDIRFVVARDGYLKPDTFAEYMSRVFKPGDRVSWEDFLNIHEEVAVKIRGDVLASDEAAVAVIAHEMHELNGLRAIFEERETISAEELSRLISPGRKGNLHDQAWTIADDVVRAIRGEGGGTVAPAAPAAPVEPPTVTPPEVPATEAAPVAPGTEIPIVRDGKRYLTTIKLIPTSKK